MILDGNDLIVVWNVDDVRSLEPNMPLEDCRNVLALALDRHDANIGINWQVLQDCIDIIKESEE